MFHVKHFDLKIEKHSSLIHSIENLTKNIFPRFLLNLSKQKLEFILASLVAIQIPREIFFLFLINLSKQKADYRD